MNQLNQNALCFHQLLKMCNSASVGCIKYCALFVKILSFYTPKEKNGGIVIGSVFLYLGFLAQLMGECLCILRLCLFLHMCRKRKEIETKN